MNKYLLFNDVKFYMNHEYHINPMNIIFEANECLKIWHDRSIKPFSFKIKRKYDIQKNKIVLGCWECISHRQDNYGYPGFHFKNKMIKMHRFMYCLFNEIKNIDEIKGKIIRHDCDNRICSNPNHLKIGTHKQNMKDMVDRNRSLQGEKNYFSKLTEIDILYIRESEMELSYLSNMYGVNKNTIRRIKKRQLWKHIE